MKEKEVDKVPEEQSASTYREWFTCFSSNATTYMPEFLKDMEKRRKAAEQDVKSKNDS